MHCVALIETREHFQIDAKLQAHFDMLPDSFYPVALVANRNREPIEIFERLEIPEINSLTDYNRLLTRSEFWEKFLKYERVLICHCDSGILREGIEEFLDYDYVGAPWKFQQHGGNGGLSLRNPKVMHEICCTHKWSPGMAYEDVWFCNVMYGKYDLAPRAVCEKFSVETIYRLGTFGYHNIQGYLSRHEVDNIMYQYL